MIFNGFNKQYWLDSFIFKKLYEINDFWNWRIYSDHLSYLDYLKFIKNLKKDKHIFLSVESSVHSIKYYRPYNFSEFNITHKKVYSDFVLAIPEGKKCFAWFTNSKNGNVCYILELGENKQIFDIKIINCCFNSSLSFGTIFYGTLFNYLNNNFFSIEDIFLYKGKNTADSNTQ